MEIKNLKEQTMEAIRNGSFLMVYEARGEFLAQHVPENSRDIFCQYNNVIDEFDMRDMPVSDGINYIEEEHPEYNAHLEGIAEYEADKIEVEIKELLGKE